MPGYDVQQDLGDHEAVVKSHSLYEKEPGKLVLAFRFQFKDGEVGNKDFYPIASEKSEQLTRKALRAMGFDIDKRDLGDLGKNETLLAGQAVKLVVQEHEWNGQITNRIAFVNAIPKPATAGSLAEATKRLRAAKKGGSDDEL